MPKWPRVTSLIGRTKVLFPDAVDSAVAPANFRILSVQKAASSATVTWVSDSGRIYRLEYKDDLRAATRIPISSDVTATASTASKVDNTIGSAPHRFYRVVLLP